jgi:hypothetical protein
VECVSPISIAYSAPDKLTRWRPMCRCENCSLHSLICMWLGKQSSHSCNLRSLVVHLDPAYNREQLYEKSQEKSQCRPTSYPTTLPAMTAPTTAPMRMTTARSVNAIGLTQAHGFLLKEKSRTATPAEATASAGVVVRVGSHWVRQQRLATLGINQRIKRPPDHDPKAEVVAPVANRQAATIGAARVGWGRSA